MYATKLLIRAAFATLSLGIGTAIAQESPSGGVPDYWGAKNLEAMTRPAAQSNMTYDTGKLHSFWTRSSSAGNAGTTGGDGAGG